MSDWPERDEYEFSNPYQAATLLPPGRKRLEAERQFLEEELHRLNERLNELEHQDGSIPDENASLWSMAKGRLDQTRVIYGLVTQGILTDEMRPEGTDDE